MQLKKKLLSASSKTNFLSFVAKLLQLTTYAYAHWYKLKTCFKHNTFAFNNLSVYSRFHRNTKGT